MSGCNGSCGTMSTIGVRDGNVLAIPQVGGLHHRYERLAA